MLFTGIFRRGKIKSQIADLQMKRMKLQDKLKAILQYASNIADGIITPEEMANASSSIFGRQMLYMMRCVPTAIMQGQQAFQMYGPQYMAQFNAVRQDPTMAGMMQTNPMLLQMQFFKQALERQGKIEEKKVHEEEKAIQQDIDKVEGAIRLLEGELGSIEKALEQEGKQFAPKYV